VLTLVSFESPDLDAPLLLPLPLPSPLLWEQPVPLPPPLPQLVPHRMG
jgi:hypothetical protein